MKYQLKTSGEIYDALLHWLNTNQAVGIELTYAATTVYFSPTYSYSNYEQSIGRTNRNGQTKKMTLYLLCAPATIEKEVWAALRNKSDFQQAQWNETNIGD